MRVALVAESFLPQMNGVTNSMLRVLKHLEARGHEALVLAPGPGRTPLETGRLHGAGFTGYRSVPWPGYPEVRVALAATRTLTTSLADFKPDVLHLAAPFVLGWQGLRAAEALGVPSVAIYQTDIPGYAAKYGLPASEGLLERHLARLHNAADLTLAPSSAAIAGLEALGIERVKLWARGVDAELFAPHRRDEALRRELAPDGELIVGYVGRLAPEKQVEDLAALQGMPGVRLVVVGDGPSRPLLERALPEARFLGFRSGVDLARTVASFDLFVHPGEHETFCQTIQEALASGVPVVATGRGGPLDLVQSSRTGWLYTPGDLVDLRARVADLIGDDAKRRAFADAARASVAARTWERLGDELLEHYDDVRAARGAVVPSRIAPRRWTRYVALGDSLTEGLCDASRQAAGEWRGWADRLANLLASADATRSLDYANLAVRSKRVDEVLDEQLPKALAMAPDLVSVLVGANDLVRLHADPIALARRLGAGVARLRATGADVLVIGVFAPSYRGLGPLRARFRRFNRELAVQCAASGARFVDVGGSGAFADAGDWAADRVHLSSIGHRTLCYRAAAALGVPGAGAFEALDAAVHVSADGRPARPDADAPGERLPTARWLLQHAAPWAGRRVRGRRAGDGLVAKHAAAVHLVAGEQSTGV
ncbi:glycosyltransferase [Schumannella sp. 10F1B-5-1]|uniref:glycosyltransferase n=1 Tax=Schumannella sp. 10F1B-5-1 TaxID=2590780 RepID=UPI0011309104|nr:glycosyltransferase [Schumannella sp. 10F1B-5-1]TPW70238.1 glycosyltransferase [Schumannella sp. 10F1B-5-1]